MKILHTSDTHIKNNKYHDTYKTIFEELYKTAKNEKVDVIVHCGDICHTKTNISPEYVRIASDFLNNLSDIAPVIIIAGNHDQSLKNLDRMDSIEPIVHALNKDNIFYLKNSGEFEFSKEVTFNCLSISDKDNWRKPSNKEKINIAIYHGAIEGSKTDIGWTMKDTDDDLSIFDDFDFALLGDIHKQQFFRYRAQNPGTKDKAPTIAYCGSLIQQNFGEEVDKGVLIWEIEEKDKFSVRPVYFKNPNPFITVELENFRGSIHVPSGSYVRIILDKYYSKDEIQKIQNDIERRCKPGSIILVNKHTKEVENAIEEADSTKLNLRDSSVQRDLIKEFLASENLTEEQLQQVLEINTKYNLEAEVLDDVARNVKWSINKFEWDNLFNYKEGNSIDFSDLRGIVGIFGKNYSGKSSIIDSLLYTLFNSTSKKIRKNYDIINERKKSGKGKIAISLKDNEGMLITRETEKNTKKSKGKLVEEGKTELNLEFYAGSNTMPLNGNDRNETDKNIRKQIGTIEDFCNTSLSTQHGSLDFINEGSTKRKEILANFLDLQFFENKYKPANQYANELKAIIKKYDKDYSKIIADYYNKLKLAEENLKESNDAVEKVKKDLEDIQLKIGSLNNDLAKIEDPVDIERARLLHEELNSRLFLTDCVINNKTEESKNLESTIVKIKQVLEKLNIDELKKKQEISKKLVKEIDALIYEKKTKNNFLSIHKKSAEILDVAACGKDLYKECFFKKSATESLEEISIIQLALKSIEKDEEKLKGEYAELDIEKVNEYIDKYHKLDTMWRESEKKISTLLKEIVNLQNEKSQITSELVLNEKVINKYESNKELYDNIIQLKNERTSLQGKKNIIAENLKEAENENKRCVANLATLQNQIKNCEDDENTLCEMKKTSSSYELFLKCTHNSGIPFELIKKTLPVVNRELNSILSGIVGFEAFFANEDGKLEIYIQHPGLNPRAIENCSGAEKSLVAMAIRLALIKCGSLPVSDIFILDEPATSLDAEHIESFIRILEMIKTHFKVVLLITHLDILKDSVDKIIEINKDSEGFAYIS